MSSPTPVEEAIQSSELSGLVELFEIDLSAIASGAPVIRLVGGLVADMQVVVRNSLHYFPAPIEATGFDRTTQGAPPEPTFRIGDLHGGLRPWVFSGQHIVGAEFTRLVVLRDHLDDGVDPDPTAYVIRDVYQVEQLMPSTRAALEFRLVPAIDQGNRKLPGRQILRESCLHRYRVWDGAAWDYTQATCPYTGATMFDVADATTTTQSEDQCSRKLSGCRLRFPSAALPTTAYPGIARRR